MAPRRNPVAASASDTLRTKFDSARDRLLTSGLYLGDRKFQIGQVIWRRIGTDNCLVTKESAKAVDAAHAAVAATETAPGEDSTTATSPEYELAIVSAVVYVTDDDFWMTSCGNWKGPHEYCPKFSDVKLTCTGMSPSETPFREDFPTVLANLTTVANLSARFTNKKGLFVERPPNRKIKFRHVLFEKLPEMNPQSSGSESASESAELPAEYRIENWPCGHNAAKNARDQMVNEFRVLPIPAYDMQSNLVHPTQYRRTLKDAVVAIRFTLKHWAIDSTDIYNADIVNMRVLMPPKNPVTPQRRKFALTDPFDPKSNGSPTKKPRIGTT